MRIADVTEVQNLFEMPYLDAGQIDWGLSDPRRNGWRKWTAGTESLIIVNGYSISPRELSLT